MSTKGRMQAICGRHFFFSTKRVSNNRKGNGPGTEPRKIFKNFLNFKRDGI